MRPVGERVPLADEIAERCGTHRALAVANALAFERNSAVCHDLWDTLLEEEYPDDEE